MSGKNQINEFCLVLTTVADLAQARTIARQLVQQKLAACVNMLEKVRSVYEWQGKLEESTEILLIIKTRWQNWPALSATISRLHPYQVPELLALNIDDGGADYLAWLAQSTNIVDA